MWQLLKQTFKSFKKSILLIFGLFFISSVIVFTSFSFFYLNKNISDSINFLNKTSNKSDSIVRLNYSDFDNIRYVQKNNNKTITNIDEFVPVNKEIYVSNIKLIDPMQNWNIVFPYTDKDFMNPNLNLKPYETRSNGMIASYGADKEGYPHKMDISNNYNNWRSLSFGFNRKGEQPVTILDNIVFTKDGKKISSYIQNNSFSQKITFMYGHFKPGPKNQLSTPIASDLSNFFSRTDITPYTGINPNLTFLDSIFNIDVNIGPKMNLDLIDLSLEHEIIRFILYSKNLKTEIHPVYELTIDESNFNPLEKGIIEWITTTNNQKLINEWNQLKKIEIPLKDRWWNNDLVVKKALIESALITAYDELKSFFNNLVEDFINYKITAFDKNIKKSFQSQFLIRDEETSKKFIVSRKENVDIDKIVYTDGSKLPHSNYSFTRDELFKEEFINWPSDNNVNKKYFFNLIKFFKRSVVQSVDKYPQYLIESLNTLEDAIINKKNFDIGMYRFVFAYFNMSYIYDDPVKKVSDNNNGISIYSPLKRGLTQIYNATSVFVPDINSYTAVVNDKFLIANNKEIFPKEKFKELYLNFISNQMTSHEFLNVINSLEDKYTVKINAKKFIIIGTGISSEMAFPSTSIETPFPNPSDEGVVYVTDSGYKTILETSPFVQQYKFFSLEIFEKNWLNSFLNSSNILPIPLIEKIDELNRYLSPYLKKDNNQPIVYSLNDFLHVNNLLTMRVNIPIFLQVILNTVATVVIVIFTLLGLYLSFLLIKGFINKNIVELSIIKANGFSTFKIALSMSSFGFINALLASVIGYTFGYLMQYIFFSVISSYWYIPMEFSGFSAILFFITLFTLFIIFVFYTFIILIYVFKTPIHNLMSQSTEFKTSKMINVLRKQKRINPLLKLRISLSISNLSRTMFFVTLCSIGLATSLVGISMPEKISTSYANTVNTKQYSYRFSFIESNEQTGIYKKQPYSELGFSDLSQGLIPFYKTKKIDNDLLSLGITNIKPGMYYKKPNESVGDFYLINDNSIYPSPYDLADLKVRELSGKPLIKNGNPLYYGNIFIPSFNANNELVSNSNFFHNGVFTKWLLDFTIPTFNLNPWNVVKSKMPKEVIARAESQDQEFLEAIYNFKKNNLGGSFSQNDLDLFDVEAKKYLTYDSIKNEYSLNPKATVSIGKPDDIGFTVDFLKFIGKVYGQKELSDKDVKLSFGIVPYNDDTEFFSQANVAVFNKKNKLLSKSINLIGIQPKSKYIKLVDDKNNNLNKLLFENFDINNKVFNVVINEGAKLKYNLKVNDVISVKTNNGYFKQSYNILNYLGLINKNIPLTDKNNVLGDWIKLKVVGISNLSFNNEFYVCQDLANLINGSYINYDFPNNKKFSFNGQYIANKSFDQNTKTFSPNVNVKYEIEKIDPKNYFFINPTEKIIPFNGIMTNSKNPVFLNKSISFLSRNGLWNLWNYSNQIDLEKEISSYSTDQFPDNPYEIIRMILATNNSKMLEWINGVNSYQQLLQLLKTKLNTSTKEYAYLLIDTLQSKQMQFLFSDIENFSLLDSLYNDFGNSISIINQISLTINISLILVMILVISATMLSNYNQIILYLKTLGYTDKQNINSIFFTFIPIILLSIILGFVISVISINAITYLVYYLSSIYLNTSILWTHSLISIAIILLIILINFIFIYIIYKKQKLSHFIKN